MKELFWMMIGICIGTIFHADIPVLNTISAEKIKMLVTQASNEVSDKADIAVEEIQTPPTRREIRKIKVATPKSLKINQDLKKEIRKNNKKGSFLKKDRKDKGIISSVEM